MSESEFEVYEPTATEQMLAQYIDGLVESMLAGRLAGIGVCAVDVNGEPVFFYLNKPDEAVLDGALSKLVGLYKTNTKFGHLANAPRTNRSYRSH